MLHFGRAWAGFAGEVEGIADNYGGDGVAAGQTGEGTEIVAAVAVHFEREDRLSGQAELVGDSDADAFGADVEAEIARW